MKKSFHSEQVALKRSAFDRWLLFDRWLYGLCLTRTATNKSEWLNLVSQSRTPEDRFIQNLIDRIQTLLDMDVSALPKRMNTDLSEWRGGGLKQHIEVFVSRCRADGFGIWTPKS